MGGTVSRLRFGESAVANEYIQALVRPDNKVVVSDVYTGPAGLKTLTVGVFQVAGVSIDKAGVEKLVGVLLSRLEQM